MNKTELDFLNAVSDLTLTDDLQGNLENAIKYLAVEKILCKYLSHNPLTSECFTTQDSDSKKVASVIVEKMPHIGATALMTLEACTRAGYSQAICKANFLSSFMQTKDSFKILQDCNQLLKVKNQISENQLHFIKGACKQNINSTKDHDYSFLADCRCLGYAFLKDSDWRDYVRQEYLQFVSQMGHSPLVFTNKLLGDLINHKFKSSYSTIKRFKINFPLIINSKRQLTHDFCREIYFEITQSKK